MPYAREPQVTRSSDLLRPKRLYLVSVAVVELLAADVRHQLKVMSTGVKCFERQESKVRPLLVALLLSRQRFVVIGFLLLRYSVLLCVGNRSFSLLCVSVGEPSQ